MQLKVFVLPVKEGDRRRGGGAGGEVWGSGGAIAGHCRQAMKRHGDLLAAIADPDNLRLAFWKASKGQGGLPGVPGAGAASCADECVRAGARTGGGVPGQRAVEEGPV